jgi:mono/diheme cytochrome c family protein
MNTPIAKSSVPMILSLLAINGATLAQEAGDVTRGKDLYDKQGCYGCHGYNGETGARDLVATNSPLIADLNTFRMFLRLRGDVAPLLPSTRMPNYPASSLSDKDVADIFAYIKTFKLNAPPLNSVPTLQKILQSAQSSNPALKNAGKKP